MLNFDSNFVARLSSGVAHCTITVGKKYDTFNVIGHIRSVAPIQNVSHKIGALKGANCECDALIKYNYTINVHLLELQETQVV